MIQNSDANWTYHIFMVSESIHELENKFGCVIHGLGTKKSYGKSRNLNQWGINKSGTWLMTKKNQTRKSRFGPHTWKIEQTEPGKKGGANHTPWYCHPSHLVQPLSLASRSPSTLHEPPHCSMLPTATRSLPRSNISKNWRIELINKSVQVKGDLKHGMCT
jgi:hypothetical protein